MAEPDLELYKVVPKTFSVLWALTIFTDLGGRSPQIPPETRSPTFPIDHFFVLFGQINASTDQSVIKDQLKAIV